MRILHLNPFFFPYAGGIERRILEVGRRHARHHEVFLLTSRLEGTAPSETRDGIQVRRLPSKFRLRRLYNPPLAASRRLEEAMRSIRPDVVDFHSRWSPSYARAYRRTGAARVFTYHNTYGEGSGVLGFLSRLNDRWTRSYVAESHRIVCISQFIWDNLKAHGFPAERFALVPNGVDPEALRAQSQPPRGAAPTLVAVGRVVHVKGFDVLLHAMTRLDPGLRLVICGEGPQRGSLRRLAARLGIEGRVELPGWVEEPRKLGLIAASTAFVHPSRFEAFGLAPLEALALGTPVIATRVGGLPELVGDAGLLVPPEDPDALAEAIRRVIGDASLRASLQRRALERARGYSWDRIADGLLGVYEEALQAGKT